MTNSAEAGSAIVNFPYPRARMLPSLIVPGRPEVAADVRRFVGDTLGQDHPECATVIFLTSELVSNSVRHSASACSGGMITVTVRNSSDNAVRVEVTDDGAVTVPALCAPGCQDESGRGLQLVSAMASVWNCYRRGARTVTWFELAPPEEPTGLFLSTREVLGSPTAWGSGPDI